MMEQDTVRLLRECDAGIQMGVSALEDVLPRVKSEALRKSLSRCRSAHQELGIELQDQLDRYRDEGKSPGPVARGMAWAKTTMRLQMDESDAAIAALLTDGCSMGVRSLSQSLNDYPAADGSSRGLCQRLIELGEGLEQELRPYL